MSNRTPQYLRYRKRYALQNRWAVLSPRLVRLRAVESESCAAHSRRRWPGGVEGEEALSTLARKLRWMHGEFQVRWSSDEFLT